MHGDPVHRSPKLIDQRRGKQMRLAHHPRLVRVIQRALSGSEQVGGCEVIRRRPEEMSTDVTAEERVLWADLIIPAADVLILIYVGGQAESSLAAAACGGRQQGRQLVRSRVKQG